MLFEATFKALGDPTRRRILELLRRGEMSAGELGAQFDATGGHHIAPPLCAEGRRPCQR